MTSTRFNPSAEKELIEAAGYYERESEGLGADFLDEVTRCLQFACQFPKAVPTIDGSIRRLVVSRFPYSIFYRPLKNGDLRVLAVAHDRRIPKYWRKRK